MNIHKNARLTPKSRAELVRRVMEGQPKDQVAAAFGVSARTVAKWVERFQAEGEAGLQDRSSRPHRLYRPTPPQTVSRIESLRRERRPASHIALELGVSPATVSRVLTRLGLNKLKALDPPEPVRRYERQTPGELLHIDIKKLPHGKKGPGWECVHVCMTTPRASPSARSRSTRSSKAPSPSSKRQSPTTKASVWR